MVREHFYLKEVMEIYFAEYNEVQIVLQKKSCFRHVYYPLEFVSVLTLMGCYIGFKLTM
jgi:hypothetical protein